MKTIPLTNSTDVAIVDDIDFESLYVYRWFKDSSGYARTTLTNQQMHSLVLQTRVGFEIDHINRNPLDNRKSNLRYLTHQQNCANQGLSTRNWTGYKGVFFVQRKTISNWRAKITVAGKQISLGCFKTPEEAALAYNKAVIKHFPNGAFLNKI